MLTVFRSFLVIFLFKGFFAMAQPYKKIQNADSYNWMFGASWMLLDDDGNRTNIFNFGQYHSAPYPTRFFIDKYIYNGWSVEGSFSFQNYSSAKYVNNAFGVYGKLYAFDLHAKYSFYKQLKKGSVDPYIILGGAVTSRDPDPRNSAKPLSGSANLGLGVNLWFTYELGIQIQSNAKFSMTDFMGPSNYIAHTAGVVYRIDHSKKVDNDPWRRRYNIRKPGKIKLPKEYRKIGDT